MGSSIARDGRRRRVLNEEARAAAGVAASLSMNTNEGAEAPRYGEQASIEHHPQISDYVPRRKRAVLATLAGGAGVAATTLVAQHSAATIAGAAPGVTAEQFGGQLAGGAAAWMSAVALLAIAGLARLVFSLRRHRVGDVRGRYRVWKWIVGGAAALSVNAVVGLHTVLAAAAVAATGWSLTARGAEWWLAPAALVGGWIAVRLARETAESRGSLALFAAALACYGVGAAGALGWAPAALGAWSDALTTCGPIVGHAFALAGMMWFARYVVLDVQGLIDHAPRAAKAPRKREAAADEPAAEAAKPTIAIAATPAAAARRDSAPAPAAVAKPAIPEAAWDDDAADADAEDDGAGQYLSKSERKRLRKQQQRRAA
jgi:hypothetical protein